MSQLPTGYFRSVYEPRGLFINDHCLILHQDTWHLFYIPGLTQEHWTHPQSMLDLGHATSPDLLTWTPQPPVLPVTESQGWWEKGKVFAPFVIRHNDSFYMFYCGIGDVHQERIGLATSDDLYHWTRYDGNPIIWPSKSWARYGAVESGETSACRDPHVLPHDSYGFIMYWVGDVKGDPPYTCVAASISHDLVHWQEYGPLLKLRHHEGPGTASMESVGVVRYASRYFMFFNYKYGTYWAASPDPLDWEGREIHFLSTSHASEVFPWQDKWYITSCCKPPEQAASYPAFFKGLFLGQLGWDHFSVSIPPEPIGAREGHFSDGMQAEEIYPRVLEAEEIGGPMALR